MITRVIQTLRTFFGVATERFDSSPGLFSVLDFAGTVYTNLDALAVRILLALGDTHPAYRIGVTGLAAGPGGVSAPDTFWARLGVASWGVNSPGVGLFDGGALVVSGITRVSEGVQSFDVGTGGMTGGARGLGAVDLQFSRLLMTEVASGDYAAIVGGENAIVGGAHGGLFCRAASNMSGDRSAAVGGTGGAASGVGAALIGGSSGNAVGDNSAKISALIGGSTGRNSVTLCGNINSSEGDNSVCQGTGARAIGYASFTVGFDAEARLTGEMAQSCGRIAGADANGLNRPSHRMVTWIGTTVGAVTSTLYLDGVGEENAVFPANVQILRIFIQARNAGAVEGAAWQAFIAVDRQFVGASQVVGGGVAVITLVGADLGAVTWVPAVTLIPGALVRITGTGEAGKTIRWSAHCVISDQVLRA